VIPIYPPNFVVRGEGGIMKMFFLALIEAANFVESKLYMINHKNVPL
jgi:hypothetical protein